MYESLKASRNSTIKELTLIWWFLCILSQICWLVCFYVAHGWILINSVKFTAEKWINRVLLQQHCMIGTRKAARLVACDTRSSIRNRKKKFDFVNRVRDTENVVKKAILWPYLSMLRNAKSAGWNRLREESCSDENYHSIGNRKEENVLDEIISSRLKYRKLETSTGFPISFSSTNNLRTFNSLLVKFHLTLTKKMMECLWYYLDNPFWNLCAIIF